MVKLYEDGIYLRNGSEVVPEAEAAERGITQTPEDAKRGTIAYSILQAHNTSGDPEALKIRFDAMASHDITFVGIIQTARASGMEQFPLPYVLTNCHNSLCAVWIMPTKVMSWLAMASKRILSASGSPDVLCA